MTDTDTETKTRDEAEIRGLVKERIARCGTGTPTGSRRPTLPSS